MEQVEKVGPIPRGEWGIGHFFDHAEKGPMVARLTPVEGTETFGRDEFLIHGDNKHLNHTASEGCVILPHILREMIMASEDRLLVVGE
jgi:hypothetical protein